MKISVSKHHLGSNINFSLVDYVRSYWCNGPLDTNFKDLLNKMIVAYSLNMTEEDEYWVLDVPERTYTFLQIKYPPDWYGEDIPELFNDINYS